MFPEVNDLFAVKKRAGQKIGDPENYRKSTGKVDQQYGDLILIVGHLYDLHLIMAAMVILIQLHSASGACVRFRFKQSYRYQAFHAIM